MSCTQGIRNKIFQLEEEETIEEKSKS